MSNVLFQFNNNYYSGTISDSVVTFAPYGGGFVSKMELSNFLEKCVVVDALPNETIHAWVNIESEKPIKAYVNPRNRWNGWAIPAFDIETIEGCLEDIIGLGYHCERVSGGYNIALKGEIEDIEFCEDFDIVFEGKTIRVNGLMSGWCWDILVAKQALTYLIAHQDCHGHKKDTPPKIYQNLFRMVFPSKIDNSPLNEVENEILRDTIELAKTV